MIAMKLEINRKIRKKPLQLEIISKKFSYTSEQKLKDFYEIMLKHYLSEFCDAALT